MGVVMTQAEEVITAIAQIKKLEPKWEGGAPLGGEVNAQYTSPDGIEVSIWFLSMCYDSEPYCCHISIRRQSITRGYQSVTRDISSFVTMWNSWHPFCVKIIGGRRKKQKDVARNSRMIS
jgi:hypothetical protein